MTEFETINWQQRRLTYAEANERVYTPAQVGNTSFALLENFKPLTNTLAFTEMCDFVGRIGNYVEVENLATDQASSEDVSAHLSHGYFQLMECFFVDQGDGSGEPWYTLPDAEADVAYKQVQSYQRSAEILVATGDLIAREVRGLNTKDERVSIVQQTVQDFLQQSPHFSQESFAADAPGSFALTHSFLLYYFNRLEAEEQQENWQSFIDNCRSDFTQAVNASYMRQLLAKPARDLAAKVAQETPIIIMDPLLALISREADWEKFGSFNLDTRIIMIDPFTIGREAEKLLKRGEFKYTEDNEYIERFRVKGTLFHELIHAISGSEYFENSAYDDDIEEVQTHTSFGNMWPRFWIEGMAEKLANAALAELETPKYLLSDRHESNWRIITANNPRHILQSKKAAELSKQERASYPKHRLLIDTMFAKLDWQAAGLSTMQAERLAARAFTELPGEGKNTYRLQFIEAVNKAAHPGFFMKLGTLVSHVGDELVTDMLLDPAFDPHDPKALPWIASDSMRSYLATARIARSLQTVEAQYKSMEANRMHQHTLDQAIELIDHKKLLYERSIVLNAAVDGLRNVLTQRHPGRRPYNPAKDRLLISIFGAESVKFVQTPRHPENMDQHEAAISTWVKEAQKSL